MLVLEKNFDVVKTLKNCSALPPNQWSAKRSGSSASRYCPRYDLQGMHQSKRTPPPSHGRWWKKVRYRQLPDPLNDFQKGQQVTFARKEDEPVGRAVDEGRSRGAEVCRRHGVLFLCNFALIWAFFYCWAHLLGTEDNTSDARL